MGGAGSKRRKEPAEWELEYEGHTKAVSCCAFSPCGTRLVTGGADGKALVFNAKSGGQQHELAGHSEGVTCCAFDIGGALIATGSSDKTTRIWDASEGKEDMKLGEHTGHVLGLAFSKQGDRLATAGGDWTCLVWGLASGEVETRCLGHIDMVTCCGFNAEGTRLVTGSADKTLKIWDVTKLFNKDTRAFDGGSGSLVATLEGHTHHVTTAAFDAKGARVVSASLDGSARLWDVAKGEELMKFGDTYAKGVTGAALSACETRLLVSSLDKYARIFCMESAMLQTKFKGHTRRVNGCAFSDEYIATVSDDRTGRLWIPRNDLLKDFDD